MSPVAIPKGMNLDDPVMQPHGEFIGRHSLVLEPILDGVPVQHGEVRSNIWNRRRECILQLSGANLPRLSPNIAQHPPMQLLEVLDR